MPSTTGRESPRNELGTAKARQAAPKPLGKTFANLVVTKDTGEPKAEFRVQCEVLLEPEDGMRLAQLLLDPRTPQTLAKAEQLVLDNVHPAATEAFIKILKMAFADQPEQKK